MRLVRIYATAARILASYLFLRLWRPFLSPERYAARLQRRHTTNARRLLRAILSAGGLFIKVGQLISILANVLPPEFRGELAGLQDRLPPHDYEEIAARIRAELGDSPENLFAQFDRMPLATASLAQVHAATLADGRRVAVKVQHGAIERVARQDLAIIKRILKVVQWVTGVRGIESYHPEITHMIEEELDFSAEARNIERIGAHFAGDVLVHVPVVVSERSSSRVLTTEFIDGAKITDFDALQRFGLDRRVMAERVVGAYCKMIFVDGVYHADPHPGNILVTPSGGVAFVDFGAVGVVAPHMREGIPAFFEGVIRRDLERITAAIRTMGFVARDAGSDDVAKRVIAYFQQKFFADLAGDSWSLGELQVDIRSRLDTIADLRKLDVTLNQITTSFQVPKDWVLLERTLVLLIGLCTELDASWNPMLVIRPYLEDVVLGEDRDWQQLVRAALGDMAKVAVTIPEDVKATLARVNAGEMHVRVPEVSEAARLIYAGVQQLVLGAFATAAGVVAYQAYDRGHESLARWLATAAAFAALGVLLSVFRTGRRRPIRHDHEL